MYMVLVLVDSLEDTGHKPGR